MELLTATEYLEKQIERVEAVVMEAHLNACYWNELQAFLADNPGTRLKAECSFYFIKKGLFGMATLRVLDLYGRPSTLSLQWLSAEFASKAETLQAERGISPEYTEALVAYINRYGDRASDKAFQLVRHGRNRAIGHTDPRGLERKDDTYGFSLASLRHYLRMAILVLNSAREFLRLSQVINPHQPYGSEDIGTLIRLLELGADSMGPAILGMGWRQELADWDSLKEMHDQSLGPDKSLALPPLPEPFPNVQ